MQQLRSNPQLTAVLLVIFCMAVLGLSDNFVRFLSDDISVWQFLGTRALIAASVVAVWMLVSGTAFRPLNLRGVTARTIYYAITLYLYFTAVGYVPVAEVAAALFLAPMFILLFSVTLYGEKIGIFRIAAVLAGFAGVLIILRPFGGEFNVMSLLPLMGAIFYALGLMETRRSCSQEATATLVFWFFCAHVVIGLIGMFVIAYLLPETGQTRFLSHLPAVPSPSTMGWTVLSSLGALMAISSQTRAYQMADASVLSVFEYSFLIFASFWGWVLWGQALDIWDVIGMTMIATAGSVIAFRSAD